MNVRPLVGLMIGLTIGSSVVFVAQAQTAEEMSQALKDAQNLLLNKPSAVKPVSATNTAARLNQDLNTFLNIYTDAIPNPTEIRTTAIKDNLSITTVPSNPSPDQDVRVSIVSYLTSLDKALIVWSLNGKTIKQGVGEKSISFKNGSAGSTTLLRITITTNAGEKIVKDLTFNPVGVTMLWEADTYTPPFYKGKPLMTPQARVRAVAIPDIANAKNALDARNLVYLWKYNGASDAAASGYGKNSFWFTGPKPYDESDVRVRVSSLNDAITSEIKMNVPLSYPFVLFYEDHPLLGTWYNRPFGSKVTLAKQELSLTAEPYFFSNETSGEVSDYRYSWNLNQNEVQSSGKNITLRNEANTKGISELSLAIQGLKKTFQSASRSMSIDFNEDASAQKTF